MVAGLEEALRRLGAEDSTLRARLLARLAAELSYRPDGATPASREAVEMARRIGDRAALSRVLIVHHSAAAHRLSSSERLAIASELLELGGATGDAEVELRGHIVAHDAALLHLDGDAARPALAAATALAERTGEPGARWSTSWRQTAWALLEGRLAEATEMAQTTMSAGLSGGIPADQARMTAAAQLFVPQFEAGRVDDRSELMVALAPSYAGMHGPLAALHAEAGDEARARRHLDAALEHLLSVNDPMRVLVLVCVAHAVATLGDRACAAELESDLGDHPGSDQPRTVLAGAGRPRPRTAEPRPRAPSRGHGPPRGGGPGVPCDRCTHVAGAHAPGAAPRPDGLGRFGLAGARGRWRLKHASAPLGWG